MNLENLECFVSQPDPEIRLTKLKMSLKKLPVICKNIILDSVIVGGDKDLVVTSTSNAEQSQLSLEFEESIESRSNATDLFDDGSTSNCDDKDQNECLLEKEIVIIRSKEERDI